MVFTMIWLLEIRRFSVVGTRRRLTTIVTLSAKFLMIGSGMNRTHWLMLVMVKVTRNILVTSLMIRMLLILNRVMTGRRIMATVLAGLSIRRPSLLNIVVRILVTTVAMTLVVVFSLDVMLNVSVSGRVITVIASFVIML